MEVSKVLDERARWDTCMPVFANLLRPSTTTEPVVEIEMSDGEAINQSITAFRDGDGQKLKLWGDQLVSLVFDGYPEWGEYYTSQPEWVLTSLAQVLEDTSQQNDLLEDLLTIGNAMPEARSDCLSQIAVDLDRWVPQWEANAEAELSDDVGTPSEEEQRIQAYPNTDNWTYSRTPGTYFYAYLERDGRRLYMYSDDADAPQQDWHEAKYWDNLAEDAARKPENKLTARLPEWDASWAEWSVLDNRKAEGGLVYGTADEGRWYDYDGAVRAHNRERLTAAGASPEDIFVEEVRDEVMAPVAEGVMAKLPPDKAGLEGMETVVRQITRAVTSQKLAEAAPQKNGSQQ